LLGFLGADARNRTEDPIITRSARPCLRRCPSLHTGPYGPTISTVSDGHVGKYVGKEGGRARLRLAAADGCTNRGESAEQVRRAPLSSLRAGRFAEWASRAVGLASPGAPHFTTSLLLPTGRVCVAGLVGGVDEEAVGTLREFAGEGLVEELVHRPARVGAEGLHDLVGAVLDLDGHHRRTAVGSGVEHLVIELGRAVAHDARGVACLRRGLAGVDADRERPRRINSRGEPWEQGITKKPSWLQRLS
jgi:hypothetical protein